MTYEEVLRELQIDESDLEALVRDGSLEKMEEGEETWFHRSEVAAVKDDLEAMKTIHLDKPKKKDRPPFPPLSG